MPKSTVIFIAISVILIGAALANPHSIAQLPWDSSLKFTKNITPYLVVLIVSFACYSTITTIYNALGIEDTSKNSEITTGRILNIEYSSLRVGNTPRFKITAEYKNIVNTFDYLDEAVQFHFEIGDEITINYNPDNPKQANIDIEASIKNKSTPKASNAKFKVLQVNPKFSVKENLYEVIGEIHQANKEPRKAQLQEELNDFQLERFVPGAILPCLLEGEGDDLRVSFS